MTSSGRKLEIVAIDDDESVHDLLGLWLEDRGHAVTHYTSGDDGLAALAKRTPDVICLDVMMPGMDGLEVLRRIRALHGAVPVVMLTSRNVVATAVECMKLGAADYVVKPLREEQLVSLVERAAEDREPEPSEQLEARASFNGIIGESAAMRRVFRNIERVANRGITVFINGESGTGKELVARAIHETGRRQGKPFVALNCGAIPESLQESELFGHERGAFTGATGTRKGRFESAQGGTIFLDEVGELSPSAQIRLLRVLQERRVERVGGTRSIALDVRVISATHRDLLEAVRAGTFREDLYYRLVVYPIELPPLRERGDDIVTLTRYFISRYREETESPATRISAAALERLQRHDWPGNVRELENLVQRLLVAAERETIALDDLPREYQSQTTASAAAPQSKTKAPSAPSPAPAPAPSGATMQEIERAAIMEALTETGWNVAKAARQLKIGRATLYRKMQRYGIARES